MIVAAVAAGLLSGGGVALADPDPAPGPDPNGPKCWTPTEAGFAHTALVPCGWTPTANGGWQQLPPPPAP
jgi:hypothetical protein